LGRNYVIEYVGFDPGGRESFGWCVLTQRGSTEIVETGVCSSALEALGAVRSLLKGQGPACIGIDAPMYWVVAGDRGSDVRVRAALKAAGGHPATVGSVNSLRGACVAQGPIVGRMARSLWPDVPIAEAHPKALLTVHRAARDFIGGHALATEHERDAALAAYSARETLTRSAGWVNVRVEHVQELDLTAGPAALYWFPCASR
jgi:hypothetical protein